MGRSSIEIKAWVVYDKYEPFYKGVVFAETQGKAKSLGHYLDACMDSPYCDIRAVRAPEIDKYWKEHKSEMDWENPQDRFALVKELGVYCADEIFNLCECKKCSAQDICDYYKDRVAEWVESLNESMEEENNG